MGAGPESDRVKITMSGKFLPYNGFEGRCRNLRTRTALVRFRCRGWPADLIGIG
jgi:hypothetical protein